MQKEIIEYLNSQNIGVLALEMPDGSPHAAAMHFALSKDGLAFYFETNKKYRKAEALLGVESVPASLVVGASESNPRTLQVDGAACIIPEKEKAAFEEAYFAKFPNKKAKAADPDLIFFKLTPTWWKYFDFSTNPKVVLESK